MGRKKKERIAAEPKQCPHCGHIKADMFYFTTEQCARLLEITPGAFLSLIKEYFPSMRPYRIRGVIKEWSRFDFDSLLRIMGLTQELQRATEAAAKSVKLKPASALPAGFVLPGKLEPVRDLLSLDYDGPSIYFLFLNSEVQYVGQSIEPIKRVAQHASGSQDKGIFPKTFDAYLIYPVTLEELLQAERTFIAILDPPLNRSLKQKAVFAAQASAAFAAEREAALRSVADIEAVEFWSEH